MLKYSLGNEKILSQAVKEQLVGWMFCQSGSPGLHCTIYKMNNVAAEFFTDINITNHY
jgi:hypothetical protein